MSFKCAAVCAAMCAALIAVVSFYLYTILFSPVPLPNIDEDKYWGPSSRAKQIKSSDVQPFEINYSVDVINKLRNHLAEPLNLVEPLEGIGFRYGFNAHKLKELVKYWRDDYLPRWNERQQFLNSLPQYTTTIQGLKIHFIHTKDQTAKAKNVIPLLLLHGWPGSVREFFEIIPRLTKANDDTAFIVVAPSLPGYGFSEGAAKPGLGPTEVGVVLRNLMIKLGYNRFLIQGGDLGSLIGQAIATIYPKNVIGYHSNMCVSMTPLSQFKAQIMSIYPTLFLDEQYVDWIFPLGEKFLTILEESGYFHLQATKPDAIGHALSNNPVGLAAYILEKFSTGAAMKYRDVDDGGLDNHFSKDALFDNLMFYYLSNSITTSFRLYSEFATKRHFLLNMDRVPTDVPTGCARFRYDFGHVTDWQLSSKFKNLIHSTWYQKGGHFIALELPDVLYKDFIQFIKKLNIGK